LTAVIELATLTHTPVPTLTTIHALSDLLAHQTAA
ncbi:oxidoreductase, partial [Streptomyces sp. NPDC051913]